MTERGVIAIHRGRPGRSTQASVYLLSSAGSVKIGVAANLANRLRDLQAANPSAIALVCSFGPMRRAIACQVEYRAHYLLREKRVRGEWFSCSVDEAIEAVKVAKTYVRNKRANLAYVPHLRVLSSFGAGRRT